MAEQHRGVCLDALCCAGSDSHVGKSRAAADLLALQLDLCVSCGFDVAIYDEEDQELSVLASVAEVEERLRQLVRLAEPSSLVVATRLVSLDRARELAGTHADLVHVSTAGYTWISLADR